MRRVFVFAAVVFTGRLVWQIGADIRHQIRMAAFRRELAERVAERLAVAHAEHTVRQAWHAINLNQGGTDT